MIHLWSNVWVCEYVSQTLDIKTFNFLLKKGNNNLKKIRMTDVAEDQNNVGKPASVDT